MKGKERTMNDTSGRFKTDKNFKNTILKNCSRLRQRSTDDHYAIRNNTIQPRISNYKRITNYKKISSIKDNFLESKNINDISKDNISIDMNSNLPEKKSKKIFRSNIRKAFFMDFNNENKENKENNEKEENKENKEKNDSNNEEDKNKIKEKNNNENILKSNDNENDRRYNEKNRNRLLAQKTHKIKSETNDGIKELVIDMRDTNLGKGDYKRSNSIRRIMNSLYYHSYTTEKKGIIINNINNVNNINSINNSNIKNNNNNTNINKEKKKENENYKCTNVLYNKSHNSILTKNINNENDKTQAISLNNNSNSSYIYKKKNNKKIGNIFNSNNLIFNTYSTEDNSFITSDNNRDLAKKNNDSQNQKLIKVKLVYQKPYKRTRLTKENNINPINNTISINQTVQRSSKRRILFEKRKNEDSENIKENENSIEKKRNDNYLTPIIRYKDEKKLIISSKDSIFKKRNINNNDNNNNKYNNDNNSDESNNEKHTENNNENINDNKNEDNYNYNDNYIIEFFDDIIELCNGIEERTIFDILTKNINKKYIIDYAKFISEKNQNDIKDNFDYCFKYFCIILITFFFLSKDEILYKYNSIKIHLLFIQYIYSSLCYIGYQDLNSKNIKRFFKDYHFKKKVSIIQCTTSMIKLLFDEKEEYSSLNNVLKQLMVNARTTKVEDITKIINQTILFCFNTIIKGQNIFPYLKQKNKAFNNIYNNYMSNYKEENNKNDEKMPIVPYIKTRMRKKFCLVLDLDETISHSLKLNFGYYFLLRPGVTDFLTELSELYEIIIFTSSPQIYADNILDKIDEKGNLISHRLYKPHVIFERGKSVKKLNLIGRDLNKIIFVDNMKSNAKYNPKNLYLIPTWTDDIYDDELFKLKNKLKYIYTSGKFNDDITKAL